MAVRAAVYLHGLAGDAAREKVGEASLVASDLIAYLPEAFKRHEGPSERIFRRFQKV